MRLRKSASASPSQLLDQVRAAQDEHARAVEAANAKLIDAHDSVYETAVNRKQTINEQISLLQAEHEGLSQVVLAAEAGKRSAK